MFGRAEVFGKQARSFDADARRLPKQPFAHVHKTGKGFRGDFRKPEIFS